MPKIEGKVLDIVDDVVSTGGTLESLVNLITDLGGEVVTTLVVFTEGVRRNDVISLGHLPLYDKVDGV